MYIWYLCLIDFRAGATESSWRLLGFYQLWSCWRWHHTRQDHRVTYLHISVISLICSDNAVYLTKLLRRKPNIYVVCLCLSSSSLSLLLSNCVYRVKGKFLPYSLPRAGPGADPGVQAVSRQVTCWYMTNKYDGEYSAASQLKNHLKFAFPIKNFRGTIAIANAE